MRAPVSISANLLLSFFAIVLACSHVPVDAFAETGASDGGGLMKVVMENGAADLADLGIGSNDAAIAEAVTVDPNEDIIVGEGAGASRGEDAEAVVPAGSIIDQEMSLDTEASQAGSTRSFFLAQTLENTKTVPIVSAKLPLDERDSLTLPEEGSDSSADTGDEIGRSEATESVDGSEEEDEGAEPGDSALAPASVVTGSFLYGAGVYAVDSDEGTVTLAAIDPARLDATDRGVFAIPSAVFSGSDVFSVSRIATGCFSAAAQAPDAEGPQEMPSSDIFEDAIEQQSAESLLLDSLSTDGSYVSVVGIPSSVREIEEGAFDGCPALTWIEVEVGGVAYSSYNGVLYDADLSSLLLIPEGRQGAVRIPSSADMVDSEVFSHCPLVETIFVDAGSAAFSSRNGLLYDEAGVELLRVPAGRQELVIPHDTYGIAARAFDACTSLSRIVVQDPSVRSYFAGSVLESKIVASKSDVDRDDQFQGVPVPVASLQCVFSHDVFDAGSGSADIRLAAAATSTTWRPYLYRDEIENKELWYLYNGERKKCVGSYLAFEILGAYYSSNGGWRLVSSTGGEYVIMMGQYGPNYTTLYFDREHTMGPVSPEQYNSPSNLLTSSPTRRLCFCAGSHGYNISWNANGGTFTSGSATSSNMTTTGTLPVVSKAGWVFDGWYTVNSASSPGTKVVANTAISSDQTYYARWRIDVTFDTCGNGANTVRSIYSMNTAASNTVNTTTPASIPTRSGRSFAGWYTAATGGDLLSGAANATISITSGSGGTCSLYARFKATIEWNDSSGSYSGPARAVTACNSNTSFSVDVTVPTASMMSKEGYDFSGWRVSSSSGTHLATLPSTATSYSVTQSCTFVALWDVQTRTVTWHTAISSDAVERTAADWNTVHIAPTGFSLHGWSFAGWYADAACTSASVIDWGEATGPIAVDTDYYAKWTKEVTFEPQNGSATLCSTAVRTPADVAGTCITLDAPLREGWEFLGWTSSSTGTSYTVAQAPVASSVNTWYARWRMTLCLDASEGTVSASSFTALNDGDAPFGNESAIALPTPTRTGYAFTGWYADAAASGDRLDDGREGSSGSIGVGALSGNCTLYAGWTVNSYRLSWTVPYGTNPNTATEFTVEDCPLEVKPAMPFSGYAFTGWSGDGISGSPQTFSITESFLEGRADGFTLTYAASFAARDYAVHLHANDGTDAVSTIEVLYDSKVGDAEVPKRYGYMFTGYWTKGTDGTKGQLYFGDDGAYVKDPVWKDVSDVDLYARWTLMANLEVPVSAPGTVTLDIDRATEIREDAAGSQAGSVVSGVLRSSVPQEVPVASIELEALQDASDMLAATRILGAGNPEKCAVEVVAGSTAKALLRLHDPSGASMKWTPASGTSLTIPAATPLAVGSVGDDVTSDALGNLARIGELPLTYAMKLLPGFDVLSMPATDAMNEPVARIVFTVDLASLDQEWF